MNNQIPATTIETLARSIYRDASNYGFGRIDIVRLINELMDLCMHSEVAATDVSTGDSPRILEPGDQAMDLPLTGERIKIRMFAGKDDAKLLEEWLPDKYGRYFALSSVTAQSLSIDRLISSSDNHLGMITLHDGKPVGIMAFLDHNKDQRRAELRKLIGDLDSRGKGLAEEATRLWINYGFNRLGLHKIYVSTLQTQIANIKLNEVVGLRVEGLLRNEVLIDGLRHDVLRMGICNEQ
jgi:RimJ/RimL family protein N-acetyltransferase